MVSLLGHIASHGDIHRVCERAGTTAQGVRRQIGRLEHTHGGPVATSVGYRLRLTELGHRLLIASRAFYVHLDCALRTAAGAHGPSQSLRLASTVHLDGETLHEIADSELPVVRLVVHDTTTCVNAFADYEVDAALIWTMHEDDVQIGRDHVVTTVVDDPLWVVLPAGHHLSGRPSLTLADLADESWTSAVLPGGGSVVQQAYALAGLPEPARIQLCESEQVAQCLGLRDGSLTLQSLSSIPRALWGVARPVQDLDLGRILLVSDPIVADGDRERLSMVMRRRLLADHLERVAESRWSGELGEWRRRQAERLDVDLPESPAEPTALAARVNSYPLDRDDVEVLFAVRQHGSINRAASALSLSQPALTRRLQRLEAEVGVQMLFRDPRGAQPTEFLERLLGGIEHATRRFLAKLAAPAAESRPPAVRSGLQLVDTA